MMVHWDAGQAATRIVAASDSGDKAKRSADYVCDGTADDVEIQAAIDYVAGLGGGKIVLLEGTYDIETYLYFNSDDDVWLAGCGEGTILRLTDNEQNRVILLDGSDNVWITDLVIDGNKANNAQLVDNAFTQTGIHIYRNNTNTLLQRITVHDCANSNIFQDENTNNGTRVLDCRSYNSDDTGIVIDCSLYAIVRGCEAYDNTDSGILIEGTTVNEGQDYSCVSNNIVYGNNNGIVLERETLAIAVTGNVVYNQTLYGIYLLNGPKYTSVTGNTIYSAQQGVKVAGGGAANTNCDGTVISGNTIYNMVNPGGAIFASNAPYLVASGNLIRNCYNGIVFLTTCPSWVASGNEFYNTTRNCLQIDAASDDGTFSGNQLNTNTEAWFYLIRITGADRISLTGNNLKTASHTAIYITSATRCKINNNTIVTAVRHGIHLNAVTWSTVSGNSVFDCDSADAASYDGIFLEANCDDNVISNNVCVGNDRYQINIANANCDDNIVTSNRLDDTGATGHLNDAGTGTDLGHNKTT